MITAPIEPLRRARFVCALLGDISTRTLFDWIQRGKFPPPDVRPSRSGEANLWRDSTIRRAVDALSAPTPVAQPKRRARA